ncbi:hypothetical protein AMECASPLE_020666 [Ameca splendens]|uniref:Uncharacterized protein n=1 Tax=Ameca splendens TaxID=208324 RepID=A0ABV0ZNM1_9TELE
MYFLNGFFTACFHQHFTYGLPSPFFLTLCFVRRQLPPTLSPLQVDRPYGGADTSSYSHEEQGVCACAKGEKKGGGVTVESNLFDKLSDRGGKLRYKRGGDKDNKPKVKGRQREYERSRSR